jgi:hypothetical protein
MVSALGAFIRRIEDSPPDTRATWVEHFLRARIDDLPVRAPLFQRVLFPELKARYVAGDAEACLFLAKLSRELIRYRISTTGTT